MIRRIVAIGLVLGGAFGAYADTEVNESRKASDDGRLEIINRSGSLEIIGWDRNEIHVEGTLGPKVKGFEFDADRNSAEIRVVTPKRSSGSKAKLRIHVPRHTELEIEVVSASVDVDAVGGDDIAIESVSGSVELTYCPGDIEIETVSGSVRVEGAQGAVEISGVSSSIRVSGSPESVRVESVSAQIRIEGARRYVEAQTVSGQISVDGDYLEQCRAETVSGSLNFNGTLAEDGELEMTTVSGSIDVDFDGDVFGDYELSSFSGSLKCEFDSGRRQEGRRALEFSHEDGDADIQLETFSGSIRVR